MDKIVKSISKNKIKEKIPSLFLKAAKKESIDIKLNKIPKKKLKFNNSNRRFGNDITNMFKNNPQYAGFRSFHKKYSSVNNKVNMIETKTNQANNINYSLKKVNSMRGRNIPNKIIEKIEKTLSGNNLYHKKKKTALMEICKVNLDNNNNNINKNNKSNFISAIQNLSIGYENVKTTSPQKEKLIRNSKFKIEKSQNFNININNNRDLINRLKNQSSYLKSSITNKDQIHYKSKNKIISCFQLEEKENISINKHIKNEISHYHLVKGINILSKNDIFDIDQKKYIYGGKNKFNKNSFLFNEKNSYNTNLSKKKFNSKEHDLLRKIKNLKTFHPKFNNKKTKAISLHINKGDLNLEKENNKNNLNTENNIDSNNNNGNFSIIGNKKILSRSNLIKQSKDKKRNKEMQNIKMPIKEKKNEYKNQKINQEEEKNSNENYIINKVDINDNKNIEKYNERKNNEIIIEENEKNNDLENNNSKIKENNKDNLILFYKDEDEEIIDQEEKIIYFDTTNINNVQIPKEYLNIIYYNLLKEEMNELNPKAYYTYMKTQKEINEQMRGILVDWIIDVHYKFGFTDETLFMTISIIDRYCSIENITRIKYQCLGITALMIACKHEEINVPKVEDFIYITDNAYTKDEVFQMENDVLDKLNFSLLYPSPIKFYEYLSLHFNFCKKYHMLGKYLMESFLLNLKYIKYKPSVISCACAYIVMKFFKMANYRHSYDKKFYLVDENINDISYGFGVKDCAQDICVFVDNINNTNLLSCQKKYTKTEFENVATLINNNK